MTPLELYLSQSKHLSKESIARLAAVWLKSKRLSPKQVLLNFDQHDPNLYFVVSGCVRLFVIDNKGEEINLGFGYENTLITCFQSFIEGKPSLLSIEAVL